MPGTQQTLNACYFHCDYQSLSPSSFFPTAFHMTGSLSDAGERCETWTLPAGKYTLVGAMDAPRLFPYRAVGMESKVSLSTAHEIFCKSASWEMWRELPNASEFSQQCKLAIPLPNAHIHTLNRNLLSSCHVQDPGWALRGRRYGLKE